MKYIKLELDNVVYFDRSKLDLDYMGTTIVQGRNLNANLKGRANGAGKSLLASAIASFKHGEPLGQRKFKHTLLDSDSSSLKLTIEKDGSTYVLHKYRKGKSIKWDILKDGTSVEARTSTIAENIVGELLDQSEDEFYTITYLDSRRLNVMQNGSVADRMRYFTNLFRLFDYDTLKDHFNQNIKNLRDSSIEVKVLKEQLSGLDWVLSYEDPSKEIKGLQTKIRRLKRKQEYWSKQQAAERILSRYSHLIGATFDKDEYKRLLKIKQYNQEANEHNEDYNERLKEYKRWLKTEKHLLKTFKSYSVSKLRGKELYQKCRDIYLDFRGRAKQLERDKQEMIKLAEGIKQVGQLKTEKAQFTSAYCNEKLNDIENQIKSLKKIKSVCPCCGTKLSKEHKKQHLAKLKAEIPVWENHLSKAGAWEAYELMRNRHASEAHLRRYAELGDYLFKQNQDDLDLDYVFPKAEPCEEPKCMKVKAFDKKAWVALKEQKANYQTYLAVKDQLEEAQSFKRKPKPDLSDLDAALSQVGELKAQYAEWVKAKSQHKAISKQVKRLEKDLADVPLYEALADAYSNKGVKLLVMKNLATSIQRNMNKWAHLVFPEPFKFKLDVGVNQFDFWCKRKDGRVSDVRHLSGAESRAFSLLFMLSVLPLIPANRRTNLCILDEFEAGLDEPTRNLLVSQYLPTLNQIVEHIIFITPNNIPEDKSVNRRTITVVKQGSKSYIEE